MVLRQILGELQKLLEAGKSTIYSRKSLHSNPPSTLFLGSSALTRVNYLGVTDLSWSLHVRNINAKPRKLVNLLYRRFHFCSTPTLVTLYTSFIRPHLELCFSSLGPFSAKRYQSTSQHSDFCLTSLY